MIFLEEITFGVPWVVNTRRRLLTFISVLANLRYMTFNHYECESSKIIDSLARSTKTKIPVTSRNFNLSPHKGILGEKWVQPFFYPTLHFMQPLLYIPLLENRYSRTRCCSSRYQSNSSCHNRRSSWSTPSCLYVTGIPWAMPNAYDQAN